MLSPPLPRALVLLAALGLVTAVVAPATAVVAQQDPEVADGRTGGVDPGRENDDEQAFPINYTFVPLNHSPGVTNGDYEVYASGLTENITGHWVVLESAEFGFESCTPGDASAFGIDRGNDDPGTTTDVSLLTAYQTYTSTPDGIFIEFYKESALAGEPIKAFPADQVVARQNNCMSNPDEPGWYRLHGHINGSTKHDTNTDYTIYAGTQYVYICDCESRQQARETLGPPPTDQERSEATATPTTEPEGTTTATAADTTTPSPEPAAASTATAIATPTPTPDRHAETATDTPQRDQSSRQTASSTTISPTGTADNSGEARRTTARTQTPSRTATTPTLAQGPGFGSILSLLTLLGAGLVALRKKN